MKKKLDITILRPAGNDQLLINGIVTKEKRRLINDLMIQKFPNVEQVSFYKYDEKNNFAQLELAGGEFCGNATRSLAYLLLNGKPGQINIQVSGIKQVLKCGIKKEGTAFAQMPIISDINSVRKISKNLFQVDLEGIVHLVYDKPIKTKNNQQLKEFAKLLLKKQNLLSSSPAAGVMFIEEQNNEISMKPVVWVRDIETLLYETACASGTTAFGLFLVMKNNINSLNQKIKQPSGKDIWILVERNNKRFLNAVIDGPIETIKPVTKISI